MRAMRLRKNTPGCSAGRAAGNDTTIMMKPLITKKMSTPAPPMNSQSGAVPAGEKLASSNA